MHFFYRREELGVEATVRELFIVIGFLIIYMALTRFVLPKLGVPT